MDYIMHNRINGKTEIQLIKNNHGLISLCKKNCIICQLDNIVLICNRFVIKEVVLEVRKKYEDNQLVERLRKGDINAFNKLYSKFSKKLYYFVKGYLQSKEDAEELVQEVFIKIWEKRNTLRKDLSFDAYLFTIAFNAIRKHFRSKSREKKHLNRFSEGFQVEYDGIISEIECNSLRKITDNAINKLPQRRKSIYLLSREEGFTNEEIAQKLSISKKTVENQIHLTLKFLREQIGVATQPRS
jgi:RNA polymerase sigma-70 factor (ECF subfamily)